MKKKEAFKVIQDKAVPPQGSGRAPGRTGFPFDAMKVSSYFIAPNGNTAKIGNDRAGRLNRPERFVLRTVDGERRCYRIK